MPESAFSPVRKSAIVAIEFTILKDGSVRGMELAGSSRDAALERLAWGSITNSSPFPPLPSEFKGQYLYLRITDCYNDACRPSAILPTGSITVNVGDKHQSFIAQPPRRQSYGRLTDQRARK